MSSCLPTWSQTGPTSCDMSKRPYQLGSVFMLLRRAAQHKAYLLVSHKEAYFLEVSGTPTHCDQLTLYFLANNCRLLPGVTLDAHFLRSYRQLHCIGSVSWLHAS